MTAVSRSHMHRRRQKHHLCLNWKHGKVKGTLLTFLALSFTLIAHAAPCPNTRTLFAKERGSSDACCGDSAAKACGFLDLAVARADPKATITILPGTLPISKAPLGTPLEVGGKALNITGQSGAVLDCLGAACLSATCPAQPCSFTLTNVQVTRGVSPASGGCLYAEDQILTLQNASFKSCSATTLGGGVAILYGNATLDNVDVSESSVPETPGDAGIPDGGGGALSVSNASAVLSGFTASGCDARTGSGGSVLVANSKSFVIKGNSRISGSYAQVGGGMVSYHSKLSFMETTITNCQAVHGGALYDDTSEVTIESSIFSKCVANITADFSTAMDPSEGSFGGCIFSSSVTLDLMDTIVRGCTSANFGGGIDIWPPAGYESVGTAVTMTNVTVDSNIAYRKGAGVHVTSGSLILTNSTLRGNAVIDANSDGTPFGGGMALENVFSVTMTGTNFVNNSAENCQAGGVSVMIDEIGGFNFQFTVNGSTFDANKAAIGGAVLLVGGRGTFFDTNFTNNHVTDNGGGVFVQVEANFTRCLFQNNSAGSSAGALAYLSYGWIILDTCTFEDNSCVTQNGGAIWVYPDNGNMTILDSSFTNNSAIASQGGAIYSEGPSLNIFRTGFVANRALLRGGAVAVFGSQGNLLAEFSRFRENQSPSGGGAIVLGTNATGTVRASRFVRNNSTQGGAILVQEFATLSLGGGSACQENSALNGGCLALRDTAQVSLSNSTVDSNVVIAEGAAGSLTGESTISVDQVNFTGNVAPSGGCFWQEMRTSIVLRGCQILSNVAMFRGGVVYATHSSQLRVFDCFISGNRALRGGAIAVDSNVWLRLNHSTLNNNSHSALTLLGAVSAEISHTNFTGNTAEDGRNGGGVFASDASILNMRDSNFMANNATDGGGLYTDGMTRLTFNRGSFSRNSARRGGGAAFAGSTNFGVNFAAFDSNSASSSGGGVAILDLSTGVINNSTFSNNFALLSGSGVFLDRSGSGSNSTTKADDDALPAVKVLAEASSNPKTQNGTGTNATVVCSGLTLDGNVAQMQPGAAFYDSSYNPQVRVECENCVNKTAADYFTTPPTSFTFSWPGSEVVDPNNTSPQFQVLCAMGSPVEALLLVLEDAYGNPLPTDNSSLGEVIPDPRISGELRSTASGGVIELPPIFPNVDPTQATWFLLDIVVSSPLAEFPDITKQINMTFCPNGTAFNSSTYTCDECVVGSWCAAGQPQTPCKDGSFSFWPGAYDQDLNCTACEDENLDCRGGVLKIAKQAWLDPDSRNSTPRTYPCVLSNGCNDGSTYTDPDWEQCRSGFSQDSRMCSNCDKEYFGIVGNCDPCKPFMKTLMPLFFALVCVLWVLFLLLGEIYEAFGAFLDEIQYLCLIASVNANPPADWVLQLINIYNLTIFDVDIIGPDCVMNYGYWQYFFLILIVTGAGLLYYAVRFIVQVCTREWQLLQLDRRMASSDGQDDVGLEELQIEVEFRNKTNEVIQGVMSWLDLCYMGVASRVLPVFVPQVIEGAEPGSDIWVMFWAPDIEWFSEEHKIMFILSIVLCAVYLVGLPVFYAYLIFSAKKAKTIFKPDFQERFAFLTDCFKRKYYWWYFVTLLWRVLYVLIISLLESLPSVQICLIIALQVLRIAGDYRFAPLALTSIQMMQSFIQIGAILFSISLVSYNYLGPALEVFSQVVVVLSTIFVIVPGVVAVLFDFLDENISRFNDSVLEMAWEEEQERHEDEYTCIDPSEVIDLSYVAGWFRQHALFAALLQKEVLPLLLKVRDRFQAANIDGLADAEWVNSLKKPQQYGGLSQVLLGNRIGHVVVAQVPVGGSFCPDHGVWHPDGNCPIQTDRDTDRPPATDHDAGAAVEDADNVDPATAVKAGLRMRKTRKSNLEQGVSKGGKPRPEDSWPTRLEGKVNWEAHQEASERGREQPPLGASSRMGKSKRMSVSRYRGSEDDYVEARLDMSELTFAFQRNFGQLVKREKKSKVTDEALRHILQSSAVHVIFAWFTCPTSTLEDQQLFAKLVHVVRKAMLEEAGGTSLMKGIMCFYKKRGLVRKRDLALIESTGD